MTCWHNARPSGRSRSHAIDEAFRQSLHLMPRPPVPEPYWITSKMTPEQQALQQQIRTQLGVPSTFDVAQELDHRTTFLKDYLLSSRLDTLVIGVSGGEIGRDTSELQSRGHH